MTFRRTIGGPIDYARMHHWLTLAPEQQADAIRRLAALGWSDHGIAHATRLAVEQIRRVLGERDEGGTEKLPTSVADRRRSLLPINRDNFELKAAPENVLTRCGQLSHPEAGEDINEDIQ